MEDQTDVSPPEAVVALPTWNEGGQASQGPEAFESVFKET